MYTTHPYAGTKLEQAKPESASPHPS